jgi:surface antigen
VRDGHTADGRACREFQQKITVGGKSEDAFGTACQEPDGSWKIVPNAG